ncbi:MAG: two-component system histidine kinase PnpS, partial [Planctomycetota bacterium]
RMDNHASRAEVIDALRDGTGTSTRYSFTLHEPLVYVAVRLDAAGAPIGVLRAAQPEVTVAAPRKIAGRWIVISGVSFAMLAVLMAGVAQRRRRAHLAQLTEAVERFAHGELGYKLPLLESGETEALALALNRMAQSLDERIRRLVRQRNEGNAVLASMVEGVFAVDTQERLLNMNQACARLLGVDWEKSRGRSLPEVVRNPGLQHLVAGVLCGQEPVSEEITLHQHEDRFLQAHGTVLRDAVGREIGVLVVLHDVTRLRKLENVRRDFVANVSHELRTPITSIKGFVETLLDGALQNEEDARRFLQIVAAQTDRLGAIIEDLLTLSRIEQETEKAEIVLEPGYLRPVMESAVGVCLIKAAEKDVHMEVLCPDDLQTAINPPLLEQALVNLIDNAIKYSPASGTIALEAERLESEVLIRVRDQGCGIPREHLPRIFERFYRVDKARSRKLGGTGLGLAIVKHIAQSHRGRATVESTLGHGSTFTLHLPTAPVGELETSEQTT